MKTYHWETNDARLRLTLEAATVDDCSRPGAVDAAVAHWLTAPSIREQMVAMPADALRDSLREYGAWDEDELADIEACYSRILWLACIDCRENPDIFEDEASDYEHAAL